MKFLIFTTLLFLSKSLFACTCGGPPNYFCGLAGSNGLSILTVEALDFYYFNYNYVYMKVKVIEEVHNGNNEDTIIILGQDGLNCGVPLWIFESGDSLVIYAGKFKHFTWDPADTFNFDYVYYLDACDHTYLQYSNDSLYGAIYAENNSMVYEDFVNDLSTCLSYVSSSNEINDQTIFNYNPVINLLQINTTEIIKTVVIYNMYGNIIFKESNIHSTSYSKDLNGYLSGNYIIQTGNSGNLVKKISILN